jgi:hypothetical protein
VAKITTIKHIAILQTLLYTYTSTEAPNHLAQRSSKYDLPIIASVLAKHTAFASFIAALIELTLDVSLSFIIFQG